MIKPLLAIFTKLIIEVVYVSINKEHINSSKLLRLSITASPGKFLETFRQQICLRGQHNAVSRAKNCLQATGRTGLSYKGRTESHEQQFFVK